MLRQSPTLISLSKKDVKEHFENISRKTRAARCEGVAEYYHPRSPLQSYINHEPIATVDDSRERYWNSRSSQSSSGSSSPIPDADRDQPQFPDVSSDSRDTTVAGSVETTRITVSDLRASLPSLPENRLISSAGSELTDTEDGHISVGFPPSDDVDAHVPSIQQLSAQELETDRPSSPRVPAFDYGGFVESTSRDSSSFGMTLASMSENIVVNVDSQFRKMCRLLKRLGCLMCRDCVLEFRCHGLRSSDPTTIDSPPSTLQPLDSCRAWHRLERLALCSHKQRDVPGITEFEH